MTTLGPNVIKKIAHLARLEFKEDEIAQYTKDLTNILAMIEQIQAVDTTGVEPLDHPQVATQRLRSDAVTDTVNSAQQAALQNIAPHTALNLYLVPKVMEEVEGQ